MVGNAKYAKNTNSAEACKHEGQLSMPLPFPPTHDPMKICSGKTYFNTTVVSASFTTRAVHLSKKTSHKRIRLIA